MMCVVAAKLFRLPTLVYDSTDFIAFSAALRLSTVVCKFLHCFKCAACTSSSVDTQGAEFVSDLALVGMS